MRAEREKRKVPAGRLIDHLIYGRKIRGLSDHGFTGVHTKILVLLTPIFLTLLGSKVGNTRHSGRDKKAPLSLKIETERERD